MERVTFYTSVIYCFSYKECHHYGHNDDTCWWWVGNGTRMNLVWEKRKQISVRIGCVVSFFFFISSAKFSSGSVSCSSSTSPMYIENYRCGDICSSLKFWTSSLFLIIASMFSGTMTVHQWENIWSLDLKEILVIKDKMFRMSAKKVQLRSYTEYAVNGSAPCLLEYLWCYESCCFSTIYNWNFYFVRLLVSFFVGEGGHWSALGFKVNFFVWANQHQQ